MDINDPDRIWDLTGEECLPNTHEWETYVHRTDRGILVTCLGKPGTSKKGMWYFATRRTQRRTQRWGQSMQWEEGIIVPADVMPPPVIIPSDGFSDDEIEAAESFINSQTG